MRRVILLFDADCPNVSAARQNLAAAFASLGRSPDWTEVDRAADDTPPDWQGYASPTVLVDGVDVLGTGPGAGPGCRLTIPGVALLASRLS